MRQFVRKNNDPAGIYNLAYKSELDENGTPKITESVVIEGRQVYETDDTELIAILENDPEIKEVNKKARIFKKKDAE